MSESIHVLNNVQNYIPINQNGEPFISEISIQRLSEGSYDIAFVTQTQLMNGEIQFQTIQEPVVQFKVSHRDERPEIYNIVWKAENDTQVRLIVNTQPILKNKTNMTLIYTVGGVVGGVLLIYLIYRMFFSNDEKEVVEDNRELFRQKITSQVLRKQPTTIRPLSTIVDNNTPFSQIERRHIPPKKTSPPKMWNSPPKSIAESSRTSSKVPSRIPSPVRSLASSRASSVEASKDVSKVAPPISPRNSSQAPSRNSSRNSSRAPSRAPSRSSSIASSVVSSIVLSSEQSSVTAESVARSIASSVAPPAPPPKQISSPLKLLSPIKVPRSIVSPRTNLMEKRKYIETMKKLQE